MRKLLLAFLAALLVAAPAVAQKAFMVLTKENWVLHGAAVDLDFVNGLYYSKGVVPDITKYLTVFRNATNATTATDLLTTSPSGYAYKTYGTAQLRIVPGLGLIADPGHVNQLFNAAAPATQTTGSLGAGGSYTLWVNGTGSAALSNGTATNCVGTATQGSPVAVVIGTAGTCVVTVTGSLFAFELSANLIATGIQGGTFGQTAGATSFTAGDIISFVNPTVPALLASGQGTIYCEMTRPHYVYYAICVSGASTSVDKFLGTGSNGVAWGTYSHAGTVLTPTDGGPSNPLVDKLAVSWDGTGRCIVWNGGTPACDALTFAPTGTIYCFNTNGQAAGVPGRRLTFFPTRLPSATLQALTR